MATYWQVRCECADEFTERERLLVDAALAAHDLKGRWAGSVPPVLFVDLPDSDKAEANLVAADLGRVPLTRRVSVSAVPVRLSNHTGPEVAAALD